MQRALTGRLVRLLAFPLVSTALVLATELTVYFTPYFATALRDDWLHEVMYLHLLLAGSLFVLPMLTREAALPRWCTHPVRAALVFLDGIIDAVPGIVVMTHGTLIAGAWYLRHAPSWAPDVLHDQQLGGGAMIGVGSPSWWRCPSSSRSWCSGPVRNAPRPSCWTAAWRRSWFRRGPRRERHRHRNSYVPGGRPRTAKSPSASGTSGRDVDTRNEAVKVSTYP